MVQGYERCPSWHPAPNALRRFPEAALLRLKGVHWLLQTCFRPYRTSVVTEVTVPAQFTKRLGAEKRL